MFGADTGEVEPTGVSDTELGLSLLFAGGDGIETAGDVVVVVLASAAGQGASDSWQGFQANVMKWEK